VVDEQYEYTAKDKTYKIAAITMTMSKFGPSGSLKDKNIVLEHAMDVMANIMSEIFLDGEDMG
jgi:hypothetical protein